MVNKKNFLLILYTIVLIMLMGMIFVCVALNDFPTPFYEGDHYTPWETLEWKQVVAPNSYLLTGPWKTTPFRDDGDNRYIVPLTPGTRRLCWLFKWRVKITFLAAVMGIILFIIYKISTKNEKRSFWTKVPLTSLHACFFMTAFYGTMRIRWWGYG